jgi:DNA gyrase subunit A
MRVAHHDSLIEACVVASDARYVFTVSENGMGKISPLEEYREQGRGGSGIKVGATTEKTGKIIGAFTLTEEEKKEGSIILISKSGQTIRVPLRDVRATGRTTQGVILSKLKDKGDAFVSAAIVKKSEGEEEEGE